MFARRERGVYAKCNTLATIPFFFAVKSIYSKQVPAILEKI